MKQSPKVETNFSFFVTLVADALQVVARKSSYNIVTNADGNVSKYKVAQEERTFHYPLVEISLDELKHFRKENVSSFVLKLNDKYWHAKIPRHISFGYSDILGKHLCCTFGHTFCKRLSSASDEKGGCAKVRAHSVGIENFPWIKSGYETFGMTSNNNVFVVLACEHYENIPMKAACCPADSVSIIEALNSWDLDYHSFSIPKRRSSHIPNE